jgi:hypothetical protein
MKLPKHPQQLDPYYELLGAELLGVGVELLEKHVEASFLQKIWLKLTPTLPKNTGHPVCSRSLSILLRLLHQPFVN